MVPEGFIAVDIGYFLLKIISPLPFWNNKVSYLYV